VNAEGADKGGAARRSGRRSAEPLQRIPVGGGTEPAPAKRRAATTRAATSRTSKGRTPKGGSATARATAKAARTRSTSRRSVSDTGGAPAGLDRIRARRESTAAEEARDLGGERDPLGRAALFSSGSQQQPPALGTFLVECSACHRETPVTVGDLVRLSLPSIHLPLVKRYPSLMRCPACGRRTWVRVRWRL
jgi:hypothetical protein